MNKIRKKNGYWIPTENEWYKAAYYDPTLNNGSGGYWSYATRSNTIPTPVSANAVGDGSAGNVGNFANFNAGADWNNQDGNVTTVGTNGGPSYYGTYDQSGNVLEWNDLAVATDSSRGLRGGVWNGSLAFGLSSSIRGTFDPSDENIFIGFRLSSSLNPLNLPNFVTVGNPGNNNDATGYGAVDYTYQIGKYEVTNNEYVEFLNAVASTDTYGLYNSNMSSEARGGIIRSGSSGSYTYSTKPNMGNKPVNYVSWFDCARYCNWLSNGKPTGPQNKTTTESGVYPLYGKTTSSVAKNLFKINSNIARSATLPFNVMGSPGDKKVYLAWSPPKNIPISSINNYQIQYSTDNGISWTTYNKPQSTDTSCVVFGLTNNILYIFRVAAITNLSEGSYSVPSIPITPSDVSMDMYVSLNNNTLGAISSIAQNPVTTSISVYERPNGIAVNKNTNKIYISYGNNIGIIDMLSNTIVKTIPWSNSIYQLVINYANNRIYGIDAVIGRNRIVVIDGNTDSITGTISVGNNPFHIAMNNITNKLYVINNASNNMSIINCNTNTVINTVSVPNDPISININDQTNKIYIVHNLSVSPYTASISIIDGNTDSIITNFTPSNFRNDRSSIAINKTTNKIYIYNAATMFIVDGNTNLVTQQITNPLGGVAWSSGIPGAVDETKNYIYISTDNSLWVFDANSNTFVSNLLPTLYTSSLVSNFRHIVWDSITDKLYGTVDAVLGSDPRNRIVIMDSQNIAKFRSITSVGTNPIGIGVNRTTKKAYIANGGGNSISVIDTNTNTVIKTIPVGISPFSVAINEKNNRIYVLNTGAPVSVSVIDGTTDTISDTLSLPSSLCRHMCINPITNKLYVPINNTTIVVDTITNTIVKTITLSNGPLAFVGVDFISNKIYVKTLWNKIVNVIDGNNDTVLESISVPNNNFCGWLQTNSFINRSYLSDQSDGDIDIVHHKQPVPLTYQYPRITSMNSNTYRVIGIDNYSKIYAVSTNPSIRIIDTNNENEAIVQNVIVPSVANYISTIM